MTETIRHPGTGLPDPWQAPLAAFDLSHFDLYQQDVAGDYFARLRREAPVHFQAESRYGPFWSITRFDDIKAVDIDHEAFSSDTNITIVDQPEDFLAPGFIAMDPPVHDAQRKVVQPVAGQRNLAHLEATIRARAAAILDDLPVGETFDWVDRVSIELTTQMLATLFDFPFEQRRRLTRWSDVATGGKDVVASVAQRRAELMECVTVFTGLWHERVGRHDGHDLISMLANHPETADMVENPLQYLGNLMLLIVGGNDTTRNSISGGVVALNRFPDEYAKLQDRPDLIPNMVAEIIRWQTPLIHMRRTATRDVELGGERIRAGDKVIMWYLSGNRDEQVFEDADRLIIDRPNARSHVAFGYGLHRCMGNRLAEMQLRVLWEEIMARFEWVEVVDDPVRVRSNFVRGFSRLPVRLHAR